MERLIKYFVPEKYDIRLAINKEAKTLEGEEVVTGVATGAGPVKLDSVGNEIKEVWVNGRKVEATEVEGVVTLPGERKGKIEIKIKWARILNENMQGAYISRYRVEGREEVIVSTQFESHYARECFPSVDEPEAKAVFEVTITAPEGDEVLMNTEEVAAEAGKGVICHKFAPTPKMSTYLLAFVVGKFHKKTIVNEHGVKVTSYCALNQREEMLEFANEVAAKSLDYYDEKFGVKYPLNELKQVAIPDFEAGAMENWGLVTYRESCMLVDEKSSIDAHKSVAVTVAHELSHQWFGDLVTMRWWDDLWLNESFATVMEYVAVDAIYPQYKIWEDFFTGDCLAAWRRDAILGVQSVKQDVNDPAEIATLFDGAIVYAKGAHLMLMLMRLMGMEAFFSGLKEYFEKFAYENTVGDDLWECLGKQADFDVKELMEAWILRPGYPVIDTEGRQKRFLTSGAVSEDAWPLPEVKDDVSGHYILKLSEADFTEKMEKFAELGFEQRLRLLSDRVMLARAGEVPAADLLEVLMKFKDEESAAVWEVLMVAVADLKIFFEHGSAEEEEFKKFCRKLIKGQIGRLGCDPREGESQDDLMVRSMVLGLAYYGEQSTVLAHLAKGVPEGFGEQDLLEMSAETRDDVLAAKLYMAEKEGDSKVFKRILQLYEEVAEPGLKSDLLATLALAKAKPATRQLMKLLSEPEIVKPQDHLYLYIYLRRNPETKARTLEWLFDNWEALLKMTGEKSIEDYPRYTAGTVRSREEAERFYEFFAQMEEVPVLKRTLAMAREEIEEKLTLIEEQKEAVYRKLKKV